MFCTKCGKELSDNSKFCWACGASITPAAPIAESTPEVTTPVEELPATEAFVAAPVFDAPVDPQPMDVMPSDPVDPPQKTRKKWVPFAIIGGAVVAIAAIVLTILITGIFDSDKTKVCKAIEKSVNAFSKFGEDLGMPDFQYLSDNMAYSTEFSFVLNRLQGYEELSGLGLSASFDMNLPGKKLDLVLTPSYGSVDIMDLEWKFDDNMAYLGSPQITGDQFYSFNTETICADLARLGVDMDGAEDIRINVFELVQIFSNDANYSDRFKKIISNAVENLIQSIGAEKIGSEEITVNGHELNCDAYDVTLSKDAILEFYKSILECVSIEDITEFVTKLCDSLNISPEDLNFSATTTDTDEVMEALSDMLDEYGDIHLTVYLKDGYVMAVSFDINFEDASMHCVLNFGGGDNYVDDLSFSFSMDGQTMVLSSSGNHTGKNGKFTDETKLSMKARGFSMTLLSATLSFDSKKSDDNFQWSLKSPNLTDFNFNVSGNVSYDSRSITTDLNDISISQSGEELLSISLFYELGEYRESIQVDHGLELLKLSENEIRDEIGSLGDNILLWSMGLLEKLPQLQELIK